MKLDPSCQNLRNNSKQLKLSFNGSLPQENQYMNLIQQTRTSIKSMKKIERFQKARQHLLDALHYRPPRPEIHDKELPKVFFFIYTIQTSIIRDFILFIISYVFLYLVMLNYQQSYQLAIALEWSFLIIFCIDVAFQVYHKSYQTLRVSSKYSKRFYLKIIILALLVIDQIIFMIFHQNQRVIRPLRIFRAFLPLFYDQFARKGMQALLASYKDIIVYLIFYAIIIASFALIANQVIQMPSDGFDKYRQNYGEYAKSIFIIYVLSSYDSYPDNQLIAIQQSLANYALFIIFIVLNLFFFTVIPATLIFNSFKDTRSKILLIDQIKQQHSLLLCFVSLGQQDNFDIKMEHLVQFLLYVYKNKVRYIDYITYVCLKLDDNRNKTIHVNEFLQLCKILQSNSAMMPPMFGDIKIWLQFKIWLNNIIPLSQIVNGNPFKIVELVIITLCFINGVLIIVLDLQALKILDYVFTGLFVLFLIINIIGFGPQKYFQTTLHKVDGILVLVALILIALPPDIIAHNSQILIKMIRIFRIMELIQIAGFEDNGIYKRFSQLFNQTAIILPIIIKFAPMILIIYYILGIIGMESFYSTDEIDVNRNQYSGYEQFSNFKWFLGTQFILIQVLTEAGWSMVAFNQSDRFGYQELIMLYFVFCHITTVLILASLMKGLVWQVYNCVNEEYKNRRIREKHFDKIQSARQKRRLEIEQIKHQLDKSDNFLKMPNTILKKQLYQNRVDADILIKLKGIYNSQHPNKKLNRSQVSLHTLENKKILLSQIKLDVPSNLRVIVSSDKDQSENHIKHQDQFQQEMQDIIGSMIIKSSIFSQVILYPKLYVSFLQKRLIDPQRNKQNLRNQTLFDLYENQIKNQKSLNLLTSELNSILSINKSQKQQKAEILRLMVERQVLTEEQAKNLYSQNTNYQHGNQRIDLNWVVRDAFLDSTNPKLISKFQIEYFSDVYGRHFRQINRITLQPLLRYEATLTYCLRNLFRYPNVDQDEFFTILSTLEDKLSNRILKRGSLFKFVYQIDTLSDSWFSIQLKQNKDIKIHFIKSGLWVYHTNMESDTTYYGQDIFKWEGIKGTSDFKLCSGYMKRLYQAFQSLAFCLLDQNKFFSGNPNSYIYDLYCFYKDVRKMVRKQTDKPQLRISKIMLVVLSKQQERQGRQPLPYELSQLKRQQNQEKKNLSKFKFDEGQDQTFQKLKQLTVMDYQRIIQTQGLPYAFILNLMKEIHEIIQLHHKNLVDQIQRVLNKQIEQISEQKKSQVQIDS